MVDLHETSNPKRIPQIDMVGWLFVAFVLVVTAIAAKIAYDGNNTTVADTALPHVVGPPG